jgi:hypothetical protein
MVDENISLRERLARGAQNRGRISEAEAYEKQSKTYEEQASLYRKMMNLNDFGSERERYNAKKINFLETLFGAHLNKYE